MGYSLAILLAVELGGLLLIYVILRERFRRSLLAASQTREMRDEVDRLIVELNQTTDRNIVLIEDRIASLNELLGKADKKIGLLRRETERHEMGVRVYDSLGGVGAKPSEGVEDRTQPLQGAQGASPEAVMKLARAGFSPSLISTRLGIPLGEVELIISLERRKGGA
jgi:hypothetical protein